MDLFIWVMAILVVGTWYGVGVVIVRRMDVIRGTKETEDE